MKSMIVESRASNRILDFGGWTDTHFAGHGAVTSLAVTLFAHVTVKTRKARGVTIHILDYGDRIEVADVVKQRYGSKHDLLLAALKIMKVKTGLDIYITADVPPGCSTGSSAAITVALLKALSLIARRPLVPHELARLAHQIETGELGQECGVQDQIASAYGGLNFIDIYDYPNSRVSPIPVLESLRLKLESQLLLVYEGQGHLSSDVHRAVIKNLSRPGSKVAECLERLRMCAHEAKKALLNEDMENLAEVMNQNNLWQKSLHPEITTEKLKIIERIAKRHGMIGAKINGAGGGGSITILCAPGTRTQVKKALHKRGFQTLPFTICTEPARAWLL
jgi:D-glycero-alpha-D-manno-heptose-7-phosphate kinase